MLRILPTHPTMRVPTSSDPLPTFLPDVSTVKAVKMSYLARANEGGPTVRSQVRSHPRKVGEVPNECSGGNLTI